MKGLFLPKWFCEHSGFEVYSCSHPQEQESTTMPALLQHLYSSPKTYSQLLCPPWHCICPLAIDNAAFHSQHLTASFGLTHRSGKQLFWDSLVSFVAFCAALFSEQEVSMGIGRLKGKQGDWKQGEENVCVLLWILQDGKHRAATLENCRRGNYGKPPWRSD